MTKQLSIVLLLLSISACQTVPVTKPFPVAPDVLLKEPSTPSNIPIDNSRLSEVLPIIIDNNTICGENYYLLKGWQKWYQETKKLYED